MKNDIVVLMGIKQSGKDTVADYLVEKHGYVKFSLAKDLKEAAKIIFGFSDEQVYGANQSKEAIDTRWGISPRTALNILGTDLLETEIEKYSPPEFKAKNFMWAYKFKLWYDEEIKKNPNIKVVISDGRLPAEMNFLRGMYAPVLIKLIRTGNTNADNHITESGQKLVQEDITIYNDSTLDALYQKIDAIIAVEQS